MRFQICTRAIVALALCTGIAQAGTPSPPPSGAAPDTRLTRARQLLVELRAPVAGMRGEVDAAELESGRAELDRLRGETTAAWIQSAPAGDTSCWSDVFEGPGSGELVSAATMFQSTLVMGGRFNSIGGRTVRNVARWVDGVWLPMGSGIPHLYNGGITSLFAHDGALYASGTFELAGSTSSIHLARWTGVDWVAEPMPPWDEAIDVLEYEGATILAGMRAPNSGYPKAIWRWAGSSWKASASKTEDTPGRRADQIARDGDVLYVGGKFETFGAVTARNIAAMPLLANGFGPARALGFGLDGPVSDLIMYEGDLIAVGDFTSAFGGTPLARVGRWDGSAWRPMGPGFNWTVSHLAIHRGQLIAAGDFTRSGPRDVVRLAVWTGAAWETFAGGLQAWPYALYTFDDQLLAVASPIDLGMGRLFRGLARWDNRSWRLFGEGLTGPVRSLCPTPDALVAGGAFSTSGYAEGRYLSKFSGDRWHSTPDTPAAVNATAYFNGEITVAGTAIALNVDRTIARVGKLVGTRYVALDNGPDGEVLALHVYGRSLLAGGLFARAGGAPAACIAQWDGATWTAMGGGTDGPVHCITTYQRGVVVGGEFSQAGGNAARNVARWDGSGWTPMGEGLPQRVECLSVYRGELYAGGLFAAQQPGVPGGIARWTGQRWEPVGDGLDGFVLALQPVGDLLLAGGWFAPVSDRGGPNVAVFDGGSWRGFGSGFDGWVEDIAEYEHHVYFGGVFRRAGDRASGFMARLDQSLVPQPWPPYPDQPAAGADPVVRPNPFNPNTTVSFSLAAGAPVRAEVFDLQGRLVRQLLDERLPAGAHAVTWNGTDASGSTVATGVYLLKLDMDGRAVTRKVVLLK